MNGRTVKKGEISLESLLPSNLSTEERERELKILREKEERAIGTSPSTPSSSGARTSSSEARRRWEEVGRMTPEEVSARWMDVVYRRGKFKDSEEY